MLQKRAKLRRLALLSAVRRRILDAEGRSRRKIRVGRAWTAYLELSETAEWMERKLRAPLEVFGLTREEFRLMLMLYRGGPLSIGQGAAQLGRFRQNVEETIRRAEEYGWVRREALRLSPAEVKETRLPKERRGKPRQGLRVSRVGLTAQGERLIGNVLPKQEQIVKSLLWEMNSREMDTLGRICRKMRGSELLPFWGEVIRVNRE
jgi:DNA-binding MarR family transcriptional regulator